MKIVIVGGGKVGFAIAREMAHEGHSVTIIDNDRNAVEKNSSLLDCMVLYGDGATISALRQADVAHCDLLISAMPEGKINLITCILARKMGCTNTIARYREQSYREEIELIRHDLGLSMAVSPEASASKEMFRLLQLPGFKSRESFAKSRAEIVSLVLDEKNPLCNCRLMDLPRVLHQKVLVCAVRRGEDVTIPDGGFVLAQGDEVYFTAPAEELSRLLDNLGMRKKRARNIMIIGGGNISESLAEMLCRAGAHVKVIEKNPEICRGLAERLPQASILCGDGTSQRFLRSEGIEQMDAVVTLMNLDEENVFVLMFANMLGVPQTITKINRTEYLDICRSCGIDHAISPKTLCAQEVVRYVRAMQNTDAESVLSMYEMVNDKVEALEFEVPDMPHLGEKLMDLHLRPNILLACITRRGQLLFPGGGDCLQKGDIVIVVSAKERHIVRLEDIFAD